MNVAERQSSQQKAQKSVSRTSYLLPLRSHRFTPEARYYSSNGFRIRTPTTFEVARACVAC